MVLTRSRSGEQAPQRDEGRDEDSAVPSTSGTSRTVTASEGGTTTSGGATTSGGTTTDATQHTLRPGSVHSRRSTTSKMKIQAAMKRAELKLKQARLEAELQEVRLQRLRAEAETSSEEDEEIEDDLASVRISTWLNEPQPRAEGGAAPELQQTTHQLEEAAPQPEEAEEKRTGPQEGRRGVAPPTSGHRGENNPLRKPAIEQENEERKTGHQRLRGQEAGLGKTRMDEEPAPARQSPVIDVATLAAALAQAARSTREPPKYIQELPFFNGNANEWLAFKAAYYESHQYFTKTENIARIRRSLRGTAREAAGCLLLSQPDPAVVIEALERRFGRPEALVIGEIEKVKMLHKLTDNPRDLCIFAGKIGNIVGTVEALKRPQYLHSPEMTRAVIEKLTPIMKNKWYDYAAVKKEDIPELKKMSMFLNEEADKCGAYAVPEHITIEDTTGQERPRRRRFERTFALEKRTKTKEDEDRCVLCKQEHKLPDCKKFLSSDVNARWEIAKKNRICFRCLRSTHRRFVCKAPPCGRQGCPMRHHKLLHYEKEASQAPPSTRPEERKEAVTSSVEIATAASSNDRRRAYLKIAPIVVTGPLGSVNTYALLDEGSTVTLIDASIADVIGADGPVNTMYIQGVGTEMKHEHSKVVTLRVKGKYAPQEYLLDAARTVERLDFAPETIREEQLEACKHLQDIKEEITYQRASPKVLIGQDNWHLIVTRELRVGRRDQPVASYTELGWVLHGCQSSLTDTVLFCGNIRQARRHEEMEEMIKNHFKLESLCVEPRKPREDPEERALKILEEKSRRLPDGRFETGLLWKQEDVKIPNNFREAEKRLYNLEKKLDRQEELKMKYEERMENLFTSGYAERATSPPQEGRTWYLPHFPVINPGKPHKPPRLVHDASAKTTGTSLNEMLLSGPDLLQSLPGVIMRFRQHPYAVTADIKEMFMQIKIREEDRDALRFLWRGNRREDPPEEFRMTSVIFGATSSPCTALYIKNRNAREFEQDYPEAAAAIKKNHYMDDYLQSFATTEEAKEITKNVDFIHKQAGFVLSGWATNDKNALEITACERDSATTVTIGGSETEKTLGLLWHVKDDCVGFQVNKMKTPPDLLECRRPPTKREALSIIMALFDPLGLISPVTTPAKRIFQYTWRYKTDWDDPLPTELRSRWATWIATLRSIDQLRIPRCYDYGLAITRQLHTFVDASEEAYAAAVYWRVERADGSIRVSLAAAKSRVTPLKPVSVPRLELQAALLGARLAQTVRDEHDFEVASKTYWSESRTALAWIRSEPRTYKAFVAHRLAEIEETTKKDEWRWLPSEHNVADDATRATPDGFDSQHRWFIGPSFLTLPEGQWPREKTTAKRETGEERERCHATTETTRSHAHLPNIEKFSRWNRLIRTTARVLQFIELCQKKTLVAATRKRTLRRKEKDPDWQKMKNKKTQSSKEVSEERSAWRFRVLSPSLLMRAERLWIRASQEESFTAERERIEKNLPPKGNDRLASLRVNLDEEGLIRLRGRVTAAQEINEDAMNPPVLEGKHRYTRLYIAHVHEERHHGGIEMVVNELRQRVWIMKIRPAVRDVLKSCIPCRMRKNKPTSPATGDLPAARLAHHARPFTFTGLDYFGPIEVTVGRHREKRWGALFTCMTSRAIHIEVAHSLSADSAVSALRRFIARRGYPTEVWSDNATCFKAADKELGEAALDALEEEATNHRINWRYIPPAAPFMGGAWERMVRAVKEALHATLHERHPSDETLITLLVEVENTVNSRPLTHVAVTPEEPEALTPNHILIGPNCHVPAPGRFEEDDTTARQQWKRAQALADMFWRRWVREYLPLLQHRREPHTTGSPPRVGDLVIICDPNLPRNTWPRGRISGVYPGADGEVRVVDVTTSSGHVLRRPTRRIVVLPEGSPAGGSSDGAATAGEYARRQ